MTFGQKVKTVRKKLFLSQQAMAREMKVAFSTLNRWENDRNEPNYIAQKTFHEFCIKHNIVFKEDGE